MKREIVVLLSALAGGSLVAQSSPFGQPLNSPAAKDVPASAPADASVPAAPSSVPSGHTAGNYSSSTAEGMADRLFNVNSDTVDWENGAIQWKGQTFNLGNARALRGRVERYLASPIPGEDVRDYEAKLQEIEDLLSPQTINRKNFQENLQKAWTLLFEAGAYELDAGNCLTIATLIENTHKTRARSSDLKSTREQQEKIRDHQRREVIRKAREVESAKDRAIRRTTSGGAEKTYHEPSEGKEALSAEREVLERINAEIALADTHIVAMGLKAKLEFQSQIVAFLFQRRYQHAIIASAFYRQMFSSTEQALKVGEKQVKEMLPISDFSPTVTSVDMLAREAMKEVEVSVNAVNELYAAGKRHAALERLQEAFFLGEHTSPIIFFDWEKKQSLEELWRLSRDLQRMGDERDLLGVESALEKIRAIAEDFPAAQISSRVANARRASNLAIFGAKQAALAQDMPKVEESLAKAAQIWPTNPAIEAFENLAMSRADGVSQLVPEFDRLYASGRHREIFERKEEFGLALMQDEQRREILKELLGNLGKIDGYILQAQVLSRQGNGYMAWDVLEDALALRKDDTALAMARAEMAPQVAEYVRLLEQARKQDEEGNPAVALAWYLAAQDLNPVSELCRLRIAALGQQVVQNAMAVRIQ